MQKKKVVIVAVVVLIAVIVGIAMLNGNKVDKNENQSSADSDNSLSQADSNLLGESFADEETGVSMQIPRGWELAPKNEKDPSSLTKFVWTQGGSAGGGQANGELLARKTSVHIDDIVRGYLEATMDINITPKLIDNQDERIGNRVVRVLSQEMPGPNDMNGRITQYIFYKNGTYYLLNYTMLSSDFEAQRAAIEASLKSLKVPQ
jgi:hypothetical protein